ncbi:22914_t:CDS:1, partial [Dentiscutata erythropus]
LSYLEGFWDDKSDKFTKANLSALTILVDIVNLFTLVDKFKGH